MEARTASLAIGILALICLGLVAAAVYPFATSDPHLTNPPDERFTVQEASDYHATGRIVVDGDVALAFDGAVSAAGERYLLVEEDGVRSEQYQDAPNETIYQRVVLAREADAVEMREQIINDDDRRLVRDVDGEDGITLVVEKAPRDLQGAVSGAATVFVRSLDVAGYERQGGSAADVAVYEPRNGWYEGDETYRITAASGVVRTDADTNAVESAAVSWELTRPAGTYATYVLARLVSDDPTRYEISYERSTGDPGVERPAWVDEVRATDDRSAGRLARRHERTSGPIASLRR